MKQTYLVYDGLNHKIGESINPNRRVEELKTANPNVILLAKGFGISEKSLHLKFKEKRLKREWFKLNNDDVESIKCLIKRPITKSLCINKKSKITGLNKRLNYIYDHYGFKSYADFSKHTGIMHQTVSNYLKGNQFPDLKKLEIIILSFPEINPKWLICGKGDMFIDEKNLITSLDLIEYMMVNKKLLLKDKLFKSYIVNLFEDIKKQTTC